MSNKRERKVAKEIANRLLYEIEWANTSRSKTKQEYWIDVYTELLKLANNAY